MIPSLFGFTMLSRVAESIYWMSRYIERAENLARFIDVTISLSLDQPDGAQAQWEPLVRTTGDEKYFAEHYGPFTAGNVIQFLAFDRNYANSMISALSIARENARTVREAISSEAWEQLNEFYHYVKNVRLDVKSTEQLTEFFQRVKQHSHLFTGILDSTMSHGQGWHFANLGRMLERADKTSRLLDVKYFTLLPTVTDVNTTLDDLQWTALLRSVSGFEMYRKRYHAITVRRVAEFLIRDEHFPRAIRFCIDQAEASLQAITSIRSPLDGNSAIEQVQRLRSDLDGLAINDVINRGMHEFIDNLQTRLNEIGSGIYRTFFERRPFEPVAAQSQSQ